jgi:hypothetical protein
MILATDTPVRLSHPLMTFWRSPGVLQLDSTDTAIVLDRVPHQLSQAVALLTSPHSRAELCTQLPDLDPNWIDWLYQKLATLGLLTDSPLTPHFSVLVSGRGPLASRVSAGLTQLGLNPGQGRFDPTDPGVDLVILADRFAEPDRALTDQLTAAGSSFLIVRIEPARAIVGPLLVAGVTACLRCDDLAHCQLDRHWPRELAQLCLQPTVPDPALLAWAAATAVLQVRSWMETGIAEVLGRCLELGLTDFRLRQRSWPPQPACQCGSANLDRLGTLAE